MLEDETAVTTITKREQLFGIALFAFALLLGFGLRFHDIGIKPLHHDEGVNSYFLLNLAHQGQYAYDPQNYHGPTLYYLAFGALAVLGETDLALRLWPALFGLLTMAILWWMRRELGTLGIAFAGLMMAVSPGLVYFSRDFIHEMSFAFFTLAIIVSAWRYLETHRFTWLASFALSLGLLFATKETALITVIVLVMAALSAAIWEHTRRLLLEDTFSISSLGAELVREARGLVPSRDHLIAATVIVLLVNVLLYSSFFGNARGVPDAVRSIFLWSKRSGNEHVHSFGYYFGILHKLELPLLISGLLGGVVVVLRGSRFGLFSAAWTLGIFLTYSLIPYKTPWLMVNMLVPLAILGGYAASEVYRLLPPVSPRLLWVVVCLVGLILAWQMALRVNFQFYDDNENHVGYLSRLGKKLEWKAYTDTQYGYVYAQTERDIFNLVKAVDDAAAALPTKETTGVFLASPAYWPLPWYLRRYKNVAYTGSLPDLTAPGAALTQPLLIANVSQEEKIARVPIWRRVTGPIALRPGERLVLYQRDQP
ncbi:MAG: flippase activity-associated protein Agl23 [Acidobacteriota bacterium]